MEKWSHPDITYEKLCQDLKVFLETILMSRGRKIREWNSETYKRALQWSDYFHNLIKSLNSSSLMALEEILIGIKESNSNIKYDLTTETLRNGRYTLLKSILNNPLVPDVIFRQAMLDYKHIQTNTHETGSQLLNNNIIERIHEHTCIDILNEINDNVNELCSLENSIDFKEYQGDSLRKRAISKLLKDSLCSTKSHEEREKVLLRILDTIKDDRHCMEIICLQLIENKSEKPNEIEREISEMLVSSVNTNGDYNVILWDLEEGILSAISKRHAKFFKAYLVYLVNKYVENVKKMNDLYEDHPGWYEKFLEYQNNIKNVTRRIKTLHSIRKLKGPTEQYLKFKQLKVDDLFNKMEISNYT